MTKVEEKEENQPSDSLWKKNVKEGELCNDPTGRHLGQGGLTNPPRKEQCRGQCTLS